MWTELVITLFIFFICCAYKYHHSQLYFKQELIKNNKTQKIYEIHITVDPKNNYVSLLFFIDQYKSYKLKPVFAVSSVMNNQYMLSCFVGINVKNNKNNDNDNDNNKNNDNEAIEKANQMTNDLINDKITVLRTKVESHNVSQFPQHEIENKNNYFEFHVKVLKYPSYKQLEKYILWFKGLSQVHSQLGISYNLCSKFLKPLLTIRIYHYGFVYAINYKNKILNDMKKNGYEFDDKIQQEYSIYDTNPQLDEGWLVKQIY